LIINLLIILKLEFEINNLNEERRKVLETKVSSLPGVNKIEINNEENRVYIDTTLPTSILQDKIENLTQSLTVLRGMGSSTSNTTNLDVDAAVAEINSDSNIVNSKKVIGVIRFVQIDANHCVLDGTIDGLSSGEHAINICEFGDLSNGCKSLGNHFNPDNKKHGLPADKERVNNKHH
jgi:copper chaperone for superoxide dismutase